MIKCPNCGAGNLDGTLFCDQCIWDLTGVESVPDDPGAMPAAAPAASAPSVDVSLVGDGAPMAEAMPAEAMPAEAMPAEAMPMEAMAEAVPADMPMDAGFADAPVDAGFDAAAFAEPPPADDMMAMDAGLAEAPPADDGMAVAEASPDAGFADAPPPDAPPPGDDAVFGGDVLPIGDGGLPVSGVVPAEPLSQAPMSDVAAASPVSQLSGSPSQLGAASPVSQMRQSQVRQSAIAPLAPGIPLSGAQPRLVVVRGVKTNVEYPLMEGTNFIGRFDEMPVDIDLSDQEPSDKIWTSRQHASVTWDGVGLTLEDLNSSNGTYLNRNKMNGGEKKPLRNGDYIQVGAVLFQVKT